MIYRTILGACAAILFVMLCASNSSAFERDTNQDASIATEVLPRVAMPFTTDSLVTIQPTETPSIENPSEFDYLAYLEENHSQNSQLPESSLLEQISIPEHPQPHAAKLPEYAPEEVPVGFVPIPFIAWVTFYVPEACGFARDEWSDWFLNWVEQGERATGFSYNPSINCGNMDTWYKMAGARNIYTDCQGECFDIAAACPQVITVDVREEGGFITGYYIQFPNNQELGVRRCYDVGGSVNILPPVNVEGSILPSFDVEILAEMHGTSMSWVGSSFRDAILWIPKDQEEYIRNSLIPRVSGAEVLESKIIH